MIKNPSFLNLSKLAVTMSDAVIMGSKAINRELDQFIKSSKKTVLDYQKEEEYMDTYSQFYDTIISETLHDPK